MGFLFSFFSGFFPMLFFAYLVYSLDRYEKEPKALLGSVFTWGAVFASGGAFLVNTLFGLGVYSATGSDRATEIATGSLIAPLVEESLKGLAVLAVFFKFRREFDSIIDGILYAAVVALGFAATENAYYIYTYGYLEDGFAGLWSMVIVRVILVGWQHPFYTAFIGIGLAVARLIRSLLVKFIAPFLGWSASVMLHSAHNTLATFLEGGTGLLAGAAWDWSGWFFMFLFILWAINRERQTLIRHLKEEVALGSITLSQYYTACSAASQAIVRLRAIFSGRYLLTNRFGDEGGNVRIISDLRGELQRLSTVIEPQT